MTNNTPISFRLTNQELSILTKEQRQGESLSLTAARLLRERLGIVNNMSTDEKITIDALIDAKVQDVIATMNEAMQINLEQISKRIDNIEQKLPKPRTRKTSQEGKSKL